MAHPTKHPSVYFIYGKDRELLYIGASFDLIVRTRCHAGQRDWWPDVVNIEVEHFPTIADARTRERDCIASLNPPHNIKSRTDLPKRERIPLDITYDNTPEPVFDPVQAARLARLFASMAGLAVVSLQTNSDVDTPDRELAEVR